ncbi:MAG: LysE family translocator [Hyphomicrobiaceae bacterium]|nr:LysE family translocator [Hyphomicrobiaceae bacterium]
MSADLLAALLLFVAVTLITPGPNNAMLMATGLTYGFRRGLPHLFGVALGFGVMVLAVGLGLGAVVAAVPAVYTALKYAGAAYLLYLAWQIATAPAAVDPAEAGGRPITFLQAAAFQWLNPKAWVMAVGAVSAYAAVAPFPGNMLLIAALFGSLGVGSSAVWLGFGTGLRRLLRSPGAVRALNIAMALLLVASLWPVLADAFR